MVKAVLSILAVFLSLSASAVRIVSFDKVGDEGDRTSFKVTIGFKEAQIRGLHRVETATLGPGSPLKLARSADSLSLRVEEDVARFGLSYFSGTFAMELSFNPDTGELISQRNVRMEEEEPPLPYFRFVYDPPTGRGVAQWSTDPLPHIPKLPALPDSGGMLIPLLLSAGCLFMVRRNM